MASCTEASVTSLVTRVLQGTNALSKRPWKASAHPEPNKRPVGEWTVQTHPIEHLLGTLEFSFFQQLRSEDQVRFILDRQRKRVIAVDLTGTIEMLTALELFPVLEQRNTEIIGSKAFEAFGILEVS